MVSTTPDSCWIPARQLGTRPVRRCGMTTKTVETTRSQLARAVGEAYDELRLLPGVDANGPALVWFAEHLFEAYQRDES
jgi:hypothetical protein